MIGNKVTGMAVGTEHFTLFCEDGALALMVNDVEDEDEAVLIETESIEAMNKALGDLQDELRDLDAQVRHDIGIRVSNLMGANRIAKEEEHGGHLR